MQIHPVYDQFPTLPLSKSNLRQLSREDTPEFFAYITHDGVKKYLSEQDTPKDLVSAEEELMYWANLFGHMRSIYWGIATKDTNKLIGTCGFNNWSRVNARAEISYDLDFNYWGQGIATEVIGAISKFAFDSMAVNRVQATVVYDNIGSIKALEKNGFLYEGRLRNYSVLHNKVVDSFMYSLIK